MTGGCQRCGCGIQHASITYVALNTGVVNDLVDVVGGHARLSLTGCNIKNLACQSADLAHALLLFLCENLDLVPSSKHLLTYQHPICNLPDMTSTHLLALRDTVRGIVGMPDLVRHLSSWAEWV